MTGPANFLSNTAAQYYNGINMNGLMSTGKSSGMRSSLVWHVWSVRSILPARFGEYLAISAGDDPGAQSRILCLQSCP